MRPGGFPISNLTTWVVIELSYLPTSYLKTKDNRLGSSVAL